MDRGRRRSWWSQPRLCALLFEELLHEVKDLPLARGVQLVEHRQHLAVDGAHTVPAVVPRAVLSCPVVVSIASLSIDGSTQDLAGLFWDEPGPVPMSSPTVGQMP